VSDSLEHHGIKGQKWGIRRKNLAKSKVGPSNDAVAAKEALSKAKKSGLTSLTNQELSALNNRLNLEQNYSRLTYSPNKLKQGFNLASTLLKTGNTVNDAIKFADSPIGKQMVKTLGKKKAPPSRSI